MTSTSRAQQAARRRTQLIDTALDVFAEKGVEGATVKDLAEAAGVAQGLLYHYFRSKQDLLNAALERHYFLPELRRITSPDRDRPAADVLVEVAERFAAMLRERRALLQVMLRELLREAPPAAVTERVAQARRESARLLGDYLASRVAAGELRPHDTEAAVRVLLATVVLSQLTDPPDAGMGTSATPPEGFYRAVVDIILYGIAAR
jgi:AcrR family transcriptional regulator